MTNRLVIIFIDNRSVLSVAKQMAVSDLRNIRFNDERTALLLISFCLYVIHFLDSIKSLKLSALKLSSFASITDREKKKTTQGHLAGLIIIKWITSHIGG